MFSFSYQGRRPLGNSVEAKKEATREGGMCVEQFGERDAALLELQSLFWAGSKTPNATKQ
jgi:hypothetical protein